MKKCSITKIEFPTSFFGSCTGGAGGLQNHSYLGGLYINVSSRATNGKYHETYCRHRTNNYTHPATSITMDETWVNDAPKFGWDILFALGFPRYNSEGEKLSLDRIDGTHGYYLSNLRWATPLQQVANSIYHGSF